MNRFLAALLALSLFSSPAFAQTVPSSITVANTKEKLARKSGSPTQATTVRTWFEQFDRIPDAAVPTPPTTNDKLDTIIKLLNERPVTVTVAPAPVAPAPVAATLPPMDYDAVLWDWGRRWHASEWKNGLSPIDWKFDHVAVVGTDVVLRLDGSGAPEIKAQNGTPWVQSGLWQEDVTVPQMRDGVIVAPLWLDNGDSGYEIDFEFAGRSGLDVTLHVKGQRFGTRLFAGQDLSGRRMQLGIDIDHAAGRIDMLVDGKVEYSFDRTKLPVSEDNDWVKPVLSMWAADPNNGGFVGWAGRFAGFAAGEPPMYMTVHGYRFTPAG